MIVELDPDAKEPPYTQIKAAITLAVATGQLVPGTPLPTIRQLAGDLDVAPNTVARAYRELE
jgi:GntR family transcriptional regulator